MEDTLGSACSTVDVFLKNALKAGYLDKNSAVNKDEAPYVWGPRAKIDFPEENVSEFIISVCLFGWFMTANALTPTALILCSSTPTFRTETNKS